MREILFRAKAKFNGTIGSDKWLVSSSIRVHSHRVNVGGIDCQPETLGQFTGLTDKNGVKIFEGDIHQWGNKKGVVEYSINLAVYFVHHMDGNQVNLPNYQLQFDTAQWGEVIGNIHDGEQK